MIQYHQLRVGEFVFRPGRPYRPLKVVGLDDPKKQTVQCVAFREGNVVEDIDIAELALDEHAQH